MRLILDSNIWSYVGVEGGKDALERLAISRDITICTPPATLLEVLRTKNQDRRDQIISAMTSRYWTRLRSEVDVECEEVVSEAKRIRPDWVRQLPQPAGPAKLRDFWTRRIWRQAASNSAPLAAVQPVITGADESIVFSVLKQNSLSVREAGFQAERLDKVTFTPSDGAPDAYLAGWDRQTSVEAWRVEGRDVYRHALATNDFRRFGSIDTTHADWLLPYLWPDRITRDWADFTRFWLEDVKLLRMPRNWLRWAAAAALLAHKITKSSGRDAQLACYLLDCDLFLSEDRRLIRALEAVREVCPVPMAEVRWLEIDKSGERAIDVIAANLE